MSGHSHSACLYDRKKCSEHCPIEGVERDAAGLVVYYDIKLKGWNCRTCLRFNSEEKETMHVCNMCQAPRPTS